MTAFKIIEGGLCGECQQEIYALTYGADETITPKKYPNDWRARQQVQTDKFNELAEQRKTRVVVVAEFFDDYAPGKTSGEIEATLCERHLRLALDDLLGDE